MDSEIRNCQNCKTDFKIEPDDFAFYERIKVPPPTFCPECRLQRKMVWRNEHFLFRKKDIYGKEIFSSFPPESEVRIIDSHAWLGDEWDQDESGMDYDWSKSFFQQFLELRKKAPIPSRSVQNAINSEYVNNVRNVKNGYLTFAAINAEDCSYSENLTNCKDCVDSSSVVDADVSYESFMNWRCSRSFFSSFCEDCTGIFLCTDCIGCSDCFGCVGLRNKNYYFFNQPLTREEYLARISGLELGKRSKLDELKNEFREFRLEFPVKYAQNYKNQDCTGEYISNSKNVRNSYFVIQGENLKYCQMLFSKNAKDSYDQYRYGDNSELVYESAATGSGVSRIMFCYQCWSNSSDLYYSYQCINSNHLFGCAGLHNKQYCILNKQYTKDEYEVMLPRIIQHMDTLPYTDAKGRIYKFGEYFPGELSPQPYNMSIAQEFFPLTREEAKERGFNWQDIGKRDSQSTLAASKLPDSIEDVDDSVLNEAIGCEHEGKCLDQCTTAFRLISSELAFYRHYKLPLPHLCPNCRYFERLKQRNPIDLWQRTCMCGGAKSSGGAYSNTAGHFHGQEPCPNTFQTSYAPDRPEIVYCEQCYQAEVA